MGVGNLHQRQKTIKTNTNLGRWPQKHCAFRGCSFCVESSVDWRVHLNDHLAKEHYDIFKGTANEAEIPEGDEIHYRDFEMYCEAIAIQEQKTAPSVGYNYDRRAHENFMEYLSSSKLCAPICFGNAPY
jgi:hypothetical protein